MRVGVDRYSAKSFCWPTPLCLGLRAYRQCIFPVSSLRRMPHTASRQPPQRHQSAGVDRSWSQCASRGRVRSGSVLRRFEVADGDEAKADCLSPQCNSVHAALGPCVCLWRQRNESRVFSAFTTYRGVRSKPQNSLNLIDGERWIDLLVRVH